MHGRFGSLGVFRLVMFLLVAALLAAGGMVVQRRRHQALAERIRLQIRDDLAREFLPEIRQLAQEEIRRVEQESRARQDALELRPVSSAAGLASLIQARQTARNRQTPARKTPRQTAIPQGGIEIPIPDDEVAGGPAESLSVRSSVAQEPVRLEDDDSYTAGREEPRVESIERTMQQRGSALLPKGSMILEPSLTYAHFSTNRIHIQGVTVLDVFTIGPVSTEKIKRDIFIQTWAFKYGLKHNLQAEIRVPFRAEYDRITNTDQTSETSRSKGGLGDIDVSLSRQIGWEEGWKPDLIASLGLKTISGEPIYNNKIALGTGHWAVRAALIAAKSSDPAVVFGSLTYTYNFERTFNNIGKIQPGDTVSYSIGTAVALSYKTAINFSLDHSITRKMIRNGQAVKGSFVNSANFKTGLNWSVTERFSVDVSVALGLTEDSPDMTIEFRFPFRF